MLSNYQNYQAELSYHLQKHFSLQQNPLNIYQNIPNLLQTDIYGSSYNDNKSMSLPFNYQRFHRQAPNISISTGSPSLSNAQRNDYNDYQQHEPRDQYSSCHGPNIGGAHNNMSLNPSDVNRRYFQTVNDYHSNPLITSLDNNNSQETCSIPSPYEQQQLQDRQPQQPQQQHFLDPSERNPKIFSTSPTQIMHNKMIWSAPYSSSSSSTSSTPLLLPSSSNDIQHNLHSNKNFPLLDQRQPQQHHQNYGSNLSEKQIFASNFELLEKNSLLSSYKSGMNENQNSQENPIHFCCDN
ncbi:unnamed protein product [Trichobilharzia regenti]|nr:unnamed protein product [Trichobilharzia regenti]